jgi:hypothetical protein
MAVGGSQTDYPEASSLTVMLGVARVWPRIRLVITHESRSLTSNGFLTRADLRLHTA